MNTFELEIWDNEGRKCSFYTVKKDESSVNETDKFFAKYENHPTLQDAANELLAFILYTIGEDHGANNLLFNRFENEVIGLPVKGRVKIYELTYHFPDFPLRIYALKITERIVILFNGGEKDGATNQSSSLNLNWIEACGFAKRILQAIETKEILIDTEKRILINHLGEEEIIL